MLSLKWNNCSKLYFFLFNITVLLTYIVWLEFYQFFYAINWYGEIAWFFDIEDKTWYAESIFKRTRIVNHYITICVIAKFWHIIFIYIFWIFFVLRIIESNVASYLVLSANLQNFIILYLMNWLLMYPWFKFIFRKFLTKTHKSLNEFHINILSNFFSDFYLFLKQFYSQFTTTSKSFFKKTFAYKINICNSGNALTKQFLQNELIILINFI
jgi:hypothetical protein